MAGSVTIIRGDARALPLAEASVDLVVTSPPYWSLRSYQDGGAHYAGQIGSEATPSEYIDALIDCTREWMRVLKPSGSIFVNLGDKYSGHQGAQGMTGQRASRSQAEMYEYRPTGLRPKSLLLLPERYRTRCVDELGLTARAVIVWSKPNGLPESVIDRVRRSHEDWVHLTVRPHYYATVDEIREAYRGQQGSTKTTVYGGGRHGKGASSLRVIPSDMQGRIPGSVWEIATRPLTVPAELDIDHFAAFPMEWPRRLIKGWCQPDGVALDPFGGTGTTALVAAMLGRTGITVDASADYCRLARWRCTDPVERARAAQVEPDRRPVDPGQTDLFGTAS